MSESPCRTECAATAPDHGSRPPSRPARPAAAREKPLTRRQKKMLAFIREFTAQHSCPPSIREITAACRISSPSVTDYNLRLLERKQYLIRRPRIARGIVLTRPGLLPLPSPVEAPALGETA